VSEQRSSQSSLNNGHTTKIRENTATPLRKWDQALFDDILVNTTFKITASALPGLGFVIRDCKTSFVVGLCVQADPEF